jgi:NADH:ubiquinone oxidoreductase subunit 3 (subunit A)
MLYNYIALVFFAIAAIAVPAGLIIASRFLGRKERGNPVKNAPYESAEESVGRARDAENEYLPFFSIFLPFELVMAIMIIWSAGASSLPYSVDIGVIALGIASALAAMFGYKMVV